MRRYLSLFIILTLLSSLSFANRDDSEILLKKLDETLSQRNSYESIFQTRVEAIKSMKAGITDWTQTYSINEMIVNEYMTYSFDSTLFYLQKNQELAKRNNDKERLIYSDLRLVQLYAKAGFHLDAAEIFRQYDYKTLSPKLYIEYCRAGHELSGELSAYALDVKGHIQQRDFYRSELLSRVEVDTYEWYNLMREQALEEGRREEETEYGLKMMSISNEATNDYGRASYFVSEAYRARGDYLMAFNYLVQSAISDILSSTRDYQSLNSIAQELFADGDISKAFRYTADYCLPDAIFYNGKLRPWQISQFFPQLERAYQQKLQEQATQTNKYLISLGILAVILVLLIIVLIRRHRTLQRTRDELASSYQQIEKQNLDLKSINNELKDLNHRLKEADQVKQEYISLFLSILSENINTTRQYKNRVLKYIRRGSTDRLIEELEALPPIDDDINQFYKMFDQTFINMYPTFVEQFNALLVDSEQSVPKGDDLLTPEQRIFALIKLGITESSRIATLLHYSVNTIYNYRAKIKNKAKVNRDDFEDAVRNIR